MKKIVLIFSLLFVLVLFAGCLETSQKPDISDTNGEPGEIEHLELDISRCESAIEITVKGCKAFDGITERIKGSDTSGGIITGVSMCADYGSMFYGWYSVYEIGAKGARYIMRLEDKQKYDEISLGINYYSVILDFCFYQTT